MTYIEKKFNPYSSSDNFRAYVYDAIILAHETKRVKINGTTFNVNALYSTCRVDAKMLETLDDVQMLDKNIPSNEEFIAFLKSPGGGYSCLFKRLRDTFAHGHYESNVKGWITIRHRFKGKGDSVERTRAFGNLKITSLKKLVAFLDTANANVT